LDQSTPQVQPNIPFSGHSTVNKTSESQPQIRQVQRQFPGRKLAVAIQVLVANHWYQYLLHNYRCRALEGLLRVQGNSQVVVVDIP
jgi:hypothetical protein